MKKHSKNELAAKLEAIGLPFAPIAKPWDLLDDPHLNASGGLLETRISGKTIRVPALPLDLGGKRLPKRSDPPDIGEHGPELLAERSEEHTSELQSQSNLVCRLLLEKKKKNE